MVRTTPAPIALAGLEACRLFVYVLIIPRDIQTQRGLAIGDFRPGPAGWDHKSLAARQPGPTERPTSANPTDNVWDRSTRKESGAIGCIGTLSYQVIPKFCSVPPGLSSRFYRCLFEFQSLSLVFGAMNPSQSTPADKGAATRTLGCLDPSGGEVGWPLWSDQYFDVEAQRSG